MRFQMFRVRGLAASQHSMFLDQGGWGRGPTRYCDSAQSTTAVAYTSRNFHGLVSGSVQSTSKRGRGRGWKFFRPAGVMAGFLVFAKSGLIRFSRTSCKVCQKDGLSRVPAIDRDNACASAYTVLLVHGSRSEDAKLATQVTRSAAFSACRIGDIALSNERHAMESENRCRFRRNGVDRAAFGFFSSAAENQNWAKSYSMIKHTICRVCPF